MKDTTMQSLERLNKLGEEARIKHSDEENQNAFNRGVQAAKDLITRGIPISLQDEAGLFMSDLQVSETMGWNSQCFNDENIELIKKLNSE